jgi:uncharacterized protein YbaA (DUF1428 family)
MEGFEDSLCLKSFAIETCPQITNMMDPKAMPFDGKRMIYGGFKVMVDL